MMVAVFLFVSQGQRGVNGTDGMDGVSGSRGATGDIVSLLASQVTYAPLPLPSLQVLFSPSSPLFSPLFTSLLPCTFHYTIFLARTY